MRLLWTPSLLVLCSCSTLIPDECRVDATSGSRTVVLQQGLGGYAGTEDSTVQLWNPGQNVGLLENLQLHLNGGSPGAWHSRAVLRFELAGVAAAGEVVDKATLHLHEHLHNAFVTSPEIIGLHELRVRPVESEVTDQQYAAGKPWSAQLGQVGVDFELAPVATYPKDLALPSGGTWAVLDVGASIRRWLAAPTTNGGWMIRGMKDADAPPASNDIHYHSAQAGDTGLRPKLELVLRKAGG